MLFFGHLGIGSVLVRPWKERLPFRWVLVGAVLPDLIDKPLYYGLSWSTGKMSGDLGLISCTHTFGHTGLLLLLLILAAFTTRSPAVAALAAGDATHLLLDNMTSLWGGFNNSTTMALVYPLYWGRFGLMETHGLQEHLGSLFHDAYTMTAEAVGLLLLLRLSKRDRSWILGWSAAEPGGLATAEQRSP